MPAPLLGEKSTNVPYTGVSWQREQLQQSVKIK